MKNPRPMRPGRNERGSTLVELVMAISVFTIGVLGMVQTSVVTRMQAKAGQISTDVWSVSQSQIETLRGLEFDSLRSGSGSVRGFPVTWTVSGTDPKIVTLGVVRPRVTGGLAVDTFVTMITDWEEE